MPLLSELFGLHAAGCGEVWTSARRVDGNQADRAVPPVSPGRSGSCPLTKQNYGRFKSQRTAGKEGPPDREPAAAGFGSDGHRAVRDALLLQDSASSSGKEGPARALTGHDT